MSKNNILEERIEDMALTPTTRMLQVARFLKPTIPMDAPAPNRPSQPVSSVSSLPQDLENVKFIGWIKPQAKWINWVTSMEAAHRAEWERAGIHDAVMNSILNFPKNTSLILWFAEKWSPETNSFVLPWGEITITLEDMMVLGGFSVLGHPVSYPLQSADDYEAYGRLDKMYRKIVKTYQKVTHNIWMTKFMGRERAFEHEAFLALWLSKYLFPSVRDTVLTETFDLAIHLAQARRIALAPAVLATLYRDLHVLQNAILDRREGEKLSQQIFAPMYYIQIWVWERFPRMRPRHRGISLVNETILAKWAELKNHGADYRTLELGTGEEHFVWQPYLKDTDHFVFHTIYKENGTLQRVDEGGYNEVVESFARCLRVSMLVGLDITRQYFPHRVSKQFGLDQDIPTDVLQIENKEGAWADYATPLGDEIIYLPSRHTKGYVSARYEEWWRNGPFAPPGPPVPVQPRRQRRRRPREN